MKKVLIVDDSRTARFFLKSCLPAEALEIHEAENGEIGVARYREIQPDLTFMDLTMPVMDGFTAIAAIRSEYPDARIVVLTADIQRRTQERIAAAGVTTFLKKPPQKAVVLEVVSSYFPDGLS
jgi:two-component system, chemotaxis family, chemotaxis protein CheY